jgi:hypothetical protein
MLAWMQEITMNLFGPETHTWQAFCAALEESRIPIRMDHTPNTPPSTPPMPETPPEVPTELPPEIDDPPVPPEQPPIQEPPQTPGKIIAAC